MDYNIEIFSRLYDFKSTDYACNWVLCRIWIFSGMGLCICIYLLTIIYAISYADFIYVIHLLPAGGACSLILHAEFVPKRQFSNQQQKNQSKLVFVNSCSHCVPVHSLGPSLALGNCWFERDGRIIACDVCHFLAWLFDLIKSRVEFIPI